VVATADNGFVRAWDDPPPGSALACDQCHKGSDFETAREVADRPGVPRFSHRSHLGSKVRTLECAECHAAPPDGAESVAIPGPESCARCHGHREPEKLKITGSKEPGGAKNDNCRFCHTPDASSGFNEFKFKVERSSGRLEPGHQWHDRSGGCASCHGLGKLEVVVTKLAALSVKSPHPDPDPPLPSLHDEWFNKRDCGRCHTAGQIERRRRDFGGGR
jgi:hypothetical protein